MNSHTRTVSAWSAAALLLACAPPVAAAQTPAAGTDASPPLTWRGALEEALANNPDLTALRGAHAAAQARPSIEKFLMPPMLEVQNFQWPFDTGNPAKAQVMVTMQQEFPGRGKRAGRVAKAEREADVAAHAVAVRARDVLSDVKQAYVELALARQLLALYERSIELTDRVTEAAEAKYAAGRSSQQDVVKGLLERSRVEEAVVTTHEQAAMAVVRLNALLGRDPAASIGAVSMPDDVALPPATVVQEAARSHQADLRAAALETAVVEADIVLAESERRPDYVVQGGYMRMPSETDAWTARVGVTWPKAPWARGRLDAVRAEAVARRDAARANERAVASETARGVQEAYVRAEAADARATLIRTRLLPRTEHVLELARLGYQSDRADFLDIIDAARMNIDMQRDLARAEAERRLAVVALERAAGIELAAVVPVAEGAR
jgi:outer membrane protein TolC